MISIVFPHAINQENDKLLRLKLERFNETIRVPFEVLYFADNSSRKELVYESWDWMIRRAKYELILWDNSDIIYSRNFMENVIKHKDDADWLGMETVECGQLEVAASNIQLDFGKTADEFDSDAFEDFVYVRSRNQPSIRPGFAWYCPSVFKKSLYVKLGGFNFTTPFPHPNDVDFRRKAMSENCKFAVINSYAYHFQRARENSGCATERQQSIATARDRLQNVARHVEVWPRHYLLGGSDRSGGLEQNKYELMRLCEFIIEKNIQSYLEVGIAHGYLLRFMKSVMKLRVRGITLDWRDSHFGLEVVYGRSDCEGIVKSAPDMDLYFIDGDHAYESVKSDYLNYRGKCKYMAFHDILGNRDCEGVRQFWSEIKGSFSHWEFVDEDRGIASGIGIIQVDGCKFD